MPVQFFCPRWGSEHIPWREFFKKVKSAGYDGVEIAIASHTSRQELDEIWSEAARQGIRMIAQHFDTSTADFQQHCTAYTSWFQLIKDLPVVKINSQTGRDFFTIDQNTTLIQMAAEHAARQNCPIVHETHRNKFSFAAHITKPYLESIPNLQITFDVSHWVCVAESWLEDQQPSLQLAMQRTGHIHARVGHPESPQIPDPRVPEWQDALDRHLQWWDQIVSQSPSMTITPEFGPYPYMVELPASRQPISNQWDINSWMLQQLIKRYRP